MKNSMQDVRNNMIETMEMLKEGDPRMDVEKAKAMAQLGQALVASAKVEVDYLKATGGQATLGSDFIPRLEDKN